MHWVELFYPLANKCTLIFFYYFRANVLLSVKNPKREVFYKRLNHLFNSKGDAWGFSDFMQWNTVKEYTYGQDNSLEFEVCIGAITT